MIQLEYAIQKILEFASLREAQNIGLDSALDRVLAEDIYSDVDMPPFNKSAMDGFACRMQDIEKELEILETIPAGKTPSQKISPGKCSGIMTGAPVPEGADCVIMKEDTETLGNKIRILRNQQKSNICYLGEDVKKGDQVLIKGTYLTPQHISVLASVGYIRPLVYQKPGIAVMVTGDELVEADKFPDNSKIRNSNGPQVVSQLIKAGCIADYRGIFPDEVTMLKNAIAEAFQYSKILIITGGASKGDFDLIPYVLSLSGFTTHFKEVAIQPGKPINFSTRDNLICFGLSGNPVSSFFQFELLVKPFLKKITGEVTQSNLLKIPLGEKVSRKKTEREYFFPVKISEDFKAFPIEFHGSAHIQSLTKADGIASIPAGITQFEKGTMVNVRQI